MSSADDIEALMHQQRAEQRAAATSQDQRTAQMIAEGARQARAFIDLMQRNRVAPEPIYGHRQIRGSGSKELTIQEFTHFETAWVVSLQVEEDYGRPLHLKCLRADGQTFDCSAWDLAPSSHHITRGLVPNPSRYALASVPGNWALYVQRRDDGTLSGFTLRDPFLRPADYAKAAGWYLP